MTYQIGMSKLAFDNAGRVIAWDTVQMMYDFLLKGLKKM